MLQAGKVLTISSKLTLACEVCWGLTHQMNVEGYVAVRPGVHADLLMQIPAQEATVPTLSELESCNIARARQTVS